MLIDIRNIGRPKPPFLKFSDKNVTSMHHIWDLKVKAKVELWEE